MTPFALKRASLSCAVLGAALALAACVDEPRYPVRLEQTPPPPPPQAAPEPPPPAPPPPPPRDPDAPQAAPSTPVQSTPLPPIGRSSSRTTPPYGDAQPSSARAADASRSTSRPAPPYGDAQPSPQARATSQPPSPWVQPTPVGATPGQVTVGRNETLFDVAERVRTPVRALIEVNGLQPPYNLAPGTVLKVPPPLFYTVQDGDTLFGIARRFNIDPRSLANLNEIQLETRIRRGQRIALPSLARDQGANGQADGASPAGVVPPVSTVARASPDYPRTPRPVATATATTTAPPIGAVPASPPLPAQASSSLSSSTSSSEDAPAVTSSDAQVAAVGKGRFSWPVKGDVISGFGPKGPGQRNDGMNIAATAGDSVHAAAAGEVVFAGDLPGFGNLVLLKHPGGFVTAYAHLSKIDVKMRDTVAQGQEVGLAGQTGPVDRPQVHFEIRYAANPRDKARPVDPSLLLPGAG